MMRHFRLTRAALFLAAFLLLPPQWSCAQEAYQIRRDVVYGHKAGMALTFDVVTPAEPNGAGVLFLVSGGWVSVWFPVEAIVRPEPPTPNQCERLLAAGFTLFIVRHGSSPYFKVPDAVADVRRAVRTIRHQAGEFGIDPERIGVCGASAGGHLSLMLGTTADAGNAESSDPVEQTSDKVQAVVAYFPPTKIDEFFELKDRFPALQFNPDLAGDVSPLLHVSEDDAPTLLVHGDQDELVPLSNSERIFQAFQSNSVPSKLIVIEGAAHSFQGENEERAHSALVDWFNQHLRAR